MGAMWIGQQLAEGSSKGFTVGDEDRLRFTSTWQPTTSGRR